MKIKVLQFRVTERYVVRDTLVNKVVRWLGGTPDGDRYHYDVVMRIEPPPTYMLVANDFLELPNKVRLKVWKVERDMVRAKTYKFVTEDLRRYHPMEVYLVYPHINNKAL